MQGSDIKESEDAKEGGDMGARHSLDLLISLP